MDGTPVGLTLPPGYRAIPGEGIDAEIGRIVKDRGPEIFYSIGMFGSSAIDAAQNDPSILWTKQAKVGGRRIEAAMRQGDRLTVTNGVATFSATRVRSHEDVVDVLMMALTFDGEARLRDAQQQLERK